MKKKCEDTKTKNDTCAGVYPESTIDFDDYFPKSLSFANVTFKSGDKALVAFDSDATASWASCYYPVVTSVKFKDAKKYKGAIRFLYYGVNNLHDLSKNPICDISRADSIDSFNEWPN